MLAAAKESPDITNYLTYLAVTPQPGTGCAEDVWLAARLTGTILLKNHVRSSYSTMSDGSKAYVKSRIIQGLSDTNMQIRSYTGNVIAEVVKRGRLSAWPEVLGNLLSLVASDSSQQAPHAQDGAMGAISKICEDNRPALETEYQGQRPVAFLLPKLLEFTNSPHAKTRERALGAVNTFLTDPVSPTAKENIHQILPHIVKLTKDESSEVRRHVCRSFAMLADGLPGVLVDGVEGIVTYTLIQQTNANNAELALDAAEFFFEASSSPELRDALGPHLQRIVPVLLHCMIHSEEDQQRLEGDEDDADEEDDLKDLKPQFASSKAGKGAAAEDKASYVPVKAPGDGYEDELSDGEVEEDDDDDYGDPEDEWNLRKCSAASLDSLASHFGGAVFQHTLPWLMENLQHQAWPHREAAVLALGAIGPGCMDEIGPHLPKLVPYLVSLLADQQPVVRQITCWSLSRFAEWAANLDTSGKRAFEPMMDGILQRMLDKNKKVQEAAASAFASLQESAGDQLEPYVQVVLQQFVRCFDRYKDKNMHMLYDCVQTLAEHNGTTLQRPELTELLMSALIKRWQKVQDQSQEMFPLTECLAFVATALGPHFAPFAEPLFRRCVSTIHENLEAAASAYSAEVYGEVPDKDFLVTSLDLLSSMIQALDKAHSEHLMASAQPNVFELLAHCMKDANDVRQSAYALLGDCAICIFTQLQPYLPTLLELLIAQLDLGNAREDPETVYRVINNACWSCGEIAMRYGTGMVPYVDRLLSKLAAIMFDATVPDSLRENTATALGRLGIGCTDQLAVHLPGFAAPFLKAMSEVEWTDEKCHAFKGFAKVLLVNPQALESCLGEFLLQISTASPEMLLNLQEDGPYAELQQVLKKYHELLGNNWEAFLGQLPSQSRQALQQLYSV